MYLARLQWLQELELHFNSVQAKVNVQDAQTFLCGLSDTRCVGSGGLRSEHINALNAAHIELQRYSLSYTQHLTTIPTRGRISEGH